MELGKQPAQRFFADRYGEKKRVNLNTLKYHVLVCTVICLPRLSRGSPASCLARAGSLLCKLAQLCQLCHLMTANKHRFAEAFPKVFALLSKSSSAIGLVAGNEQLQYKLVYYVKTN